MLQEAEKTLGIHLPEQYVASLKEYCDGGSNAFEINGAFGDKTLFVEDTLGYRKDGLPRRLRHRGELR